MNREDRAPTATTNCWRITGWSIAVLLLLLPLAAMQVTPEVTWTASDFMVAGVLIGSAGLAIELAFKRQSHRCYSAGVVLLTVTCFALTWINAAVGIVGNDHATLSLLFPVIVMLALVVAAAGRFRALALARGSTAAAAAQAMLGIVAVAIADPGYVVGVVAFHALVIAALLAAATLFCRAGAADASDPR